MTESYFSWISFWVTIRGPTLYTNIDQRVRAGYA